MYEVGQICFGSYLCIVSVWDIRRRMIPCWLLGIGGVLAVVFQLLQKNTSVVSVLAGMAVGGIFLVISKVTEEGLGYGDSLMILAVGIYMGFWQLLYLLTGAYLMAAVFAGVVLVRKRFSRKDSFPFIPFLTAAYIAVLVWGGV